MNRTAEINRKTGETEIKIKLNLDGEGKSAVSTSIPFMDHMLTLFARHGFFDLEITAKGDIEVDYHHTMEDLGLAFGMALNQSLGERQGIRRYGSFLLPMDEALAQVALDLSNRPYLVYQVKLPQNQVGDIDVQLFHEFFQAFCVKGGVNMHIDLLRCGETHHGLEAIFKGFAKALDIATGFDGRVKGVLSTKGVL